MKRAYFTQWAVAKDFSSALRRMKLNVSITATRFKFSDTFSGWKVEWR